MIAVGSRGDNEPVLALTASLLRNPRVGLLHLYMASDYFEQVPIDERVRVHDAPNFSMQSFLTAMERSMSEKNNLQGALTGKKKDPISAQVEVVGAVTTYCVTPALPQLRRIVEEVQPAVILSTTLGALVGETLAELAGVPAFVLHMQPNVPVRGYPCYLSSFEDASKAAKILASVAKDTNGNRFPSEEVYKASYEVLFNVFYGSLQPLNAKRKEYGLTPLTEIDIGRLLRGEVRSVHQVCTYATELVPRAPDIAPSVHVLPPLADAYVPPGWDPQAKCPQLVAYLSEPNVTPPVCVSLGSMDITPEGLIQVLRTILSGLCAAGVERVLLLRGSVTAHVTAGNMEEDIARWAESHVFECTESVQFAWLFPQCKAVVSHGGAGSVSAALYAGIPVAIAPHMVDQFFWAELVSGSELGAFIRPSLLNCSSDAVRDAMRCALSRQIVSNAAAHGNMQRAKKSGREQLVEVMEKCF